MNLSNSSGNSDTSTDTENDEDDEFNSSNNESQDSDIVNDLLDGDDDQEEIQAEETSENHVDLENEESTQDLIFSMNGVEPGSDEPCYLNQSKFLAKIADSLFKKNVNSSSKLLACKKLNSLNLYLNKFLNKNQNVWIEPTNTIEVIGACLQKDSNIRNEIILSNSANKLSEESNRNEADKVNLFEKCVQLLKSKNLIDSPVTLISTLK